MSNIAIIPARGGSKRIPGKNIKDFCGKPIIAYSIEAAIKSNCFDRVIVSTDDGAIAKIAVEYGAEVPFLRRSELADDYTVVTDVVINVIDEIESNLGDVVEYACLIYATAPLLDSSLIEKGLHHLMASDKSFAIGVTSYPFPIQRALSLKDGAVQQLFDSRDCRSQDLEEYYHDAAQFCWGTKEAYKERRDFFSSEAIPIIIPRKYVQDIDTKEDWDIAEALFKVFRADS